MNPDIVREGQELVARLRAERDEARQERDEHVVGEGRLQQRLADAERIMNGLAAAPAAAAAHPGRAPGCPHTRDRVGKIAEPRQVRPCNASGVLGCLGPDSSPAVTEF